MSRVIASILHGAFGDYYWQAVALKYFKRQNPDIRLKLFAASESRRQIMSALDFSFAECFLPWQEMETEQFDEVRQYQVFDPDLKKDVLAKLSPKVLAKIDRTHNRIFWRDLRGSWPLPLTSAVDLNEQGRQMMPGAIADNGLPRDLFEKRLTVGFTWRYRSALSAIKPWLQPPANVLIDKYARVFQRLIDRFDCHIIVTGMSVETTDANRQRIDAKYTSSGLDLPKDRVTYLQGLSWALEREIMRRTTAYCGMSSGFTEAVASLRNTPVYLLDPPLHYLLVLTKYRVGLFDYTKPTGFLRTWLRPHSERRIEKWLSLELSTKIVSDC